MIRLYKENYSSPNEHYIDISSKCKNSKVKEINNGSYTLEQEYVYDEKLYKLLNKKDRLCIRVNVHSGHHSFRITNVQKTLTGIKVQGETMFITDFKKTFMVGNISVVDKDCKFAMEQIKANMESNKHWSFNSNIVTKKNIKFVEETVFDCFLGKQSNTLIKRYGGVIKFGEFEVSLLRTRGNKTPKVVEFGKSITEADIQEDYSNIVTRIFPKGFDGIGLPEGSPYVDAPNIDHYSQPLTSKIVYSNVKVKEVGEEKVVKTEGIFNSLADAQKELTRLATLEFTDNKINYPKINIRVKIDNLTKTEFHDFIGFKDTGNIGIGDLYHVKLPLHGIEEEQEVISITYDTINKKYIEVELGKFILDNTNTSSTDTGSNDQVSGGSGGSTFGIYYYKNDDRISLTNNPQDICRISFGANKDCHLLMNLTSHIESGGEGEVFFEFELNGEISTLKPIQKVVQGKHTISVHMPLLFIEANIGYNLLVKMWSSANGTFIPVNNFNITVSGEGVSGAGTSYPYASIQEVLEIGSTIEPLVFIEAVSAYLPKHMKHESDIELFTQSNIAPVDIRDNTHTMCLTPTITRAYIDYPIDPTMTATSYFTIKELDDYYNAPRSYFVVAEWRSIADKEWKQICDPIEITSLVQDFEIPMISDKFLDCESELYVEIREQRSQNWLAQLHPFNIGVSKRPKDPLCLVIDKAYLDYEKNVLGTIYLEVSNINKTETDSVKVKIELADNKEIYQEWDVTSKVESDLLNISLTDVKTLFSMKYHRITVMVQNSQNKIVYKDSLLKLEFLPYDRMAVEGHCYSTYGNENIEWHYKSIRNTPNTMYDVYLTTPNLAEDRNVVKQIMSDSNGTVELLEIVNLQESGIQALGNEVNSYLLDSGSSIIDPLQLLDLGIVNEVRPVNPNIVTANISYPNIGTEGLGVFNLEVTNLNDAYLIKIELTCDVETRVLEVYNHIGTTLNSSFADISTNFLNNLCKIRILAFTEAGKLDYASSYKYIDYVTRPSGAFDVTVKIHSTNLELTWYNIEPCEELKYRVSYKDCLTPVEKTTFNYMGSEVFEEVVTLQEDFIGKELYVECSYKSGDNVVLRHFNITGNELYTLDLKTNSTSYIKGIVISDSGVLENGNGNCFILPITYKGQYSVVGTITRAVTIKDISKGVGGRLITDVSSLVASNVWDRYLVIQSENNITVSSINVSINTLHAPTHAYSSNPNDIQNIYNLSIVSGIGYNQENDREEEWVDVGIRQDYHNTPAIQVKGQGTISGKLEVLDYPLARYVRWTTTGRDKPDMSYDGGINGCEMRVLDINGNNIARNKVISKCMPVENFFSSPNNLIDGYDSSNITNTLDPTMPEDTSRGVVIDLQAIYQIKEIQYLYATGQSIYKNIRNFKLEYSKDGINWTEIYYKEKEPIVVDKYISYPISKTVLSSVPNKVKYVRFGANSRSKTSTTDSELTCCGVKIFDTSDKLITGITAPNGIPNPPSLFDDNMETFAYLKPTSNDKINMFTLHLPQAIEMYRVNLNIGSLNSTYEFWHYMHIDFSEDGENWYNMYATDLHPIIKGGHEDFLLPSYVDSNYEPLTKKPLSYNHRAENYVTDINRIYLKFNDLQLDDNRFYVKELEFINMGIKEQVTSVTPDWCSVKYQSELLDGIINETNCAVYSNHEVASQKNNIILEFTCNNITLSNINIYLGHNEQVPSTQVTVMLELSDGKLIQTMEPILCNTFENILTISKDLFELVVPINGVRYSSTHQINSSNTVSNYTTLKEIYVKSSNNTNLVGGGIHNIEPNKNINYAGEYWDSDISGANYTTIKPQNSDSAVPDGTPNYIWWLFEDTPPVDICLWAFNSLDLNTKVNANILLEVTVDGGNNWIQIDKWDKSPVFSLTSKLLTEPLTPTIESTLGVNLSTSNEYVTYNSSSYKLLETTDRDIIDARGLESNVKEILSIWKSRMNDTEEILTCYNSNYIPFKFTGLQNNSPLNINLLENLFDGITSIVDTTVIGTSLSFKVRSDSEITLSWSSVELLTQGNILVDDVDAGTIDFATSNEWKIKFEDTNYHTIKITGDKIALDTISILKGIIQVLPMN